MAVRARELFDNSRRSSTFCAFIHCAHSVVAMDKATHRKAPTPFSNSHANSHEWFGRFARQMAAVTGKPAAFLAATAVVIIWAVTGPLFGFSDTWQLVINTGTTIVTFLMVFLIQNTQNRDTMAIQVKLSELILAVQGAQNKLALAEEMSDEELERVHQQCRQRADQAMDSLKARRKAKATTSSGAKR
jgi:low affinity Fe/Cu permease